MRVIRRDDLASFLGATAALCLIAAACAPASQSVPTSLPAAPKPTEPPKPAATTAPAAAPTAPAVKPTAGATGEKVTLKIESWRSEDLTIWQDQILPAFEKQYPKIQVQFTPTAPDQYDPALRSKLEGGTAGDLIVCRPFDLSLAHFKAGFLTSLNDLPGLDNFDAVARSGWSTDDGATTFCVPMASVIHGFIFNADAFSELGLQKPATEDEFFNLLDKTKASGKYTPLALGTVATWTSASLAFNNIGPNYWKGEQGRQALIKGEAKFTDPQFVDAWRTLTKWPAYMPSGFEAVDYPDTQNLFTIGRAAVFPAGSWEISGFRKQASFKLDAFRPPVKNKGDQCFISDHIDIAMGMNARTPHPQETRTFLQWLTTPEFASLYSNALPGFFTLSKHDVKVQDPLAQEFVSWRKDCKGTIRVADQILSRGEPSTANELGLATAALLNGKASPEETAQRVQSGLDRWFKPGKP